MNSNHEVHFARLNTYILAASSVQILLVGIGGESEPACVVAWFLVATAAARGAMLGSLQAGMAQADMTIVVAMFAREYLVSTRKTACGTSTALGPHETEGRQPALKNARDVEGALRHARAENRGIRTCH
ncbi:MAG TPA: hypothetical protein VGN07_23030 [Steroidobacteraceae bacterium]|jgi:hypothetical protein